MITHYLAKILISEYLKELYFVWLINSDYFWAQFKFYNFHCFLKDFDRDSFLALGLFSALPGLIELRNPAVESELEIFFASESNDNLVGSGTRQPIDIFQAAYVKLKHSTAAEILVVFFYKFFLWYILYTLTREVCQLCYFNLGSLVL